MEPYDLPVIDKEMLRAAVSALEIPYRHYFNVTATGQENLPAEGPALLVGNHGGAVNSPDMLMLFVAWYHAQGFDKPLYSLAHDVFFKIPGLSDAMRKFGAMPASRDAAAQALREGGFLLVYPGGDLDAFKSFGSRNAVRFFGRRGFIRLALREGVPIIPVCARGGHETLFIITGGRRIAKSLGLDKAFRMKNFPISFSLPWGLTPGPFLPYIPLPIHIRLKFGAPIRFDDCRPEDAGDPAAVERCHKRVVESMQEIVDSLSERKKRKQAREKGMES